MLAWIPIALLSLLGPAHAQTLPLNGSASGSLNAGQMTISYSVTIPADGDLLLTAVPSMGLQIQIRFYDTDGSTHLLDSFVPGIGKTATLTVPHLGPGTYRVVAFRWDGSGSFTLSNAFSPPPIANDVEPDDDSAHAPAALKPGDSATGHLGYSRNHYDEVDPIDYCRLVVPADGDTTIRVAPAPTLQVQIQFYDADGKTGIASSAVPAAGATATLSIGHLGPGTYYVAVYRWDGYGAYTLATAWRPQTVANDAEPDNDVAHAIPLSSLPTGHLGYSRTRYADIDTVDLYRFSGTAHVVVPLIAAATPGLRLQLILYDTDGATQIASVTASGLGQPAVLTFNPSHSGAFYLAVARWDGYGAYGLSVSAPVDIAGIVTLPGCVNSAVPITFELRPANGGAIIDRILTLDSSGRYTLSNVAATTYTVAAKGDRWLQQAAGVDATHGTVSGVNFLLRPGDADSDNHVGILDLGILADTYNTSAVNPDGSPNPTWDPRADFNNDGHINLLDLGLLATYYNRDGDL
jgi:hypothetical protein